jgi:hypothetical protein
MANVEAITPDFEFTQPTIQRLRTEYDKLQGDHESLLRFIADPDSYMAARLEDPSITDGVHFHVQHGDVVVPVDPAPPDHQLVFTSDVKMPSHVIPMITDAVRKKQIEDIARGGGVYCSGCRRCAVVRIKELRTQEE